MCDVPNIAVFCSESIECFPGSSSSSSNTNDIIIIIIIIIPPGAPTARCKVVHFITLGFGHSIIHHIKQ
jgi:hypothetical protein